MINKATFRKIKERLVKIVKKTHCKILEELTYIYSEWRVEPLAFGFLNKAELRLWRPLRTSPLTLLLCVPILGMDQISTDLLKQRTLNIQNTFSKSLWGPIQILILALLFKQLVRRGILIVTLTCHLNQTTSWISHPYCGNSICHSY